MRYNACVPYNRKKVWYQQLRFKIFQITRGLKLAKML